MDYNAVKNYILERLSNELPDNLFYHGVHHAVFVKDRAVLIAEHENISDNELTILKTAALCHDFGFIYRYDDNECIAVEEMQKVLPEFSYSNEEIDIICDLISATKMPQAPKTYLEEILCDADMYNLGTPEFCAISQTLRDEFKEQERSFSDIQWAEFQLVIMKNHRYFTQYAKNTIELVKQANILELRRKLKTNQHQCNNTER